MKLKNLILATTTVMAATFGSLSQAQSFAQCVSTPIVQFDGTIVDAAVATPELSTLVDAVLAAGLGDALATLENITVFAPTNDAFAALPADALGAIVGDVDLLTAVLTFHVTEGAQDPRRFIPATRRPTLQGQSVFFFRQDGMPTVNNAPVSCTGVQASNGLVWIIDAVMLPAIY